MKIRNGFVSNSSASSFLVNLHGDWTEWKEKKDKLSLTESRKLVHQLKLLHDYGFRPTLAHHPMFLYTHGMEYDEKGPDGWIWKPKKRDYLHGMVRYGYSVVCNEDEVITFLLKHGIPFGAVTHYGHWHLIYNGGKVFWQVANLGEQIGMYGRKNPDTEYREIKRYRGREQKQFHRINVQEYLHPKPLTARQKTLQKKRMKKFKIWQAKMEKEREEKGDKKAGKEAVK
jgi:hypothetical protein